MNKYILITGGCGYIGSHITSLLKEKGHSIVVADNLSTGHRQNMIPDVAYEIGDIGDISFLEQLFHAYPISTVMHLAAKTSVEESWNQPGLYYEENVIKSINLMKICGKFKVKHFIFSSTAAVYDHKINATIQEDDSIIPSSIYGKSKYIAELALGVLAKEYNIQLVICRYFNVAGYHESLTMGRFHNTSLALIPQICYNIAQGNFSIAINGNDYDTADGTCVRDYVHVMDIANTHVMFLNGFHYLEWNTSTTVNIGYGQGTSVLDVIRLINILLDDDNALKYSVVDRRIQDISCSVADNTRLKSLGWCSLYESPYKEMIRSEIAWSKKYFSKPAMPFAVLHDTLSLRKFD